MRESVMRRHVRGVALAMACAASVAPGRAVARCEPLVPGTTVDLPSSLAIACGTARCRVSAAGRELAQVALAENPRLCDTTDLHVEQGVPDACDSALSRTGLSLRQAIPGRAGPLASQVVVDVLGEAQGIPWSGTRAPIKACLPRYAGKRGDVWQYTWRGEGASTVYQVFEEDESPAGQGSGDPGRRKPAPLVLSVAGTEPARPAVARPARVPGAPAARPAAPGVARF